MDKFTEALVKSREARGIMESFGFSDNIEKGFLDNLFGHGAEKRGFVIEKRGKEIKEKLRGMLSSIKFEEESLLVKMKALECALKEAPAESAIEKMPYLLNGWDSIAASLPNGYCMCGGCEACEAVTGDSPSVDPEFADKAKREYNSDLYTLSSLRIDEAMINTMLSNFKDDSVYSLTIKEASMLGW